MDVPLFWKELTRVEDLGSSWSGCGSLFPLRPPLLLNGYREFVLGTLFIGTIKVASGRLGVSLCLSGKWQGKMCLGRVLFVECSGICSVPAIFVATSELVWAPISMMLDFHANYVTDKART
eukprot:1145648-Pelagomonas_calceolata.AAC.1